MNHLSTTFLLALAFVIGPLSQQVWAMKNGDDSSKQEDSTPLKRQSPYKQDQPLRKTDRRTGLVFKWAVQPENRKRASDDLIPLDHEESSLLYRCLSNELLAHVGKFLSLQDFANFARASKRAESVFRGTLLATNFLTATSAYAYEADFMKFFKSVEFDPTPEKIILRQRIIVKGSGTAIIRFRNPKNLREIVKRYPWIKTRSEKIYFLHDPEATEDNEIGATEGELKSSYFIEVVSRVPLRTSGKAGSPFSIMLPAKSKDLSFRARGGIVSRSTGLQTFRQGYHLAASLERFSERNLKIRTRDAIDLIRSRELRRKGLPSSHRPYSYFPQDNFIICSTEEVNFYETDYISALCPIIFDKSMGSHPWVSKLNLVPPKYPYIYFINRKYTGLYSSSPLSLERGFDVVTTGKLLVMGQLEVGDPIFRFISQGEMWADVLCNYFPTNIRYREDSPSNFISEKKVDPIFYDDDSDAIRPDDMPQKLWKALEEHQNSKNHRIDDRHCFWDRGWGLVRGDSVILRRQFDKYYFPDNSGRFVRGDSVIVGGQLTPESLLHHQDNDSDRKGEPENKKQAPVNLSLPYHGEINLTRASHSHDVMEMLKDVKFDPKPDRIVLRQQMRVSGRGAAIIRFRDTKHLRDIVNRYPWIQTRSEKIYFVLDPTVTKDNEIGVTEGELEKRHFIEIISKSPLKITGKADLPFDLVVPKQTTVDALFGRTPPSIRYKLPTYAQGMYLARNLESFDTGLLRLRTNDAKRLLWQRTAMRRFVRKRYDKEYPDPWWELGSGCYTNPSIAKLRRFSVDFISSALPLICIDTNMRPHSWRGFLGPETDPHIHYIDPRSRHKGIYCSAPLFLIEGLVVYSKGDLAITGEMDIPEYGVKFISEGNIWAMAPYGYTAYGRVKPSDFIARKNRYIYPTMPKTKPKGMPEKLWEEVLKYRKPLNWLATYELNR